MVIKHKNLIIKTHEEHGFVYYSVDQNLTDEECEDLQTELGYHPGGYGFYSYKKMGGAVSWCRSTNCD